MDDKERIEELRRVTGLNWRELATKLGMATPQTFTDIKRGRHGISKALAEKIAKAYPTIRQEWILLGEGPMTVQDASASIPLMEPSAPGETSARPSRAFDAGSCFPGADMAMRYVGSGMKEYPTGCILVLKRVADQSLLVPGSDYVVETREFCALKRLQLGADANHIALYSTDDAAYPDGKPVHEPFTVPMEAVTRIFSVMGYIMPMTAPISPAE